MHSCKKKLLQQNPTITKSLKNEILVSTKYLQQMAKETHAFYTSQQRNAFVQQSHNKKNCQDIPPTQPTRARPPDSNTPSSDFVSPLNCVNWCNIMLAWVPSPLFTKSARCRKQLHVLKVVMVAMLMFRLPLYLSTAEHRCVTAISTCLATPT